jgi:cytolysin (calcineurin-like family phosphatase)
MTKTWWEAPMGGSVLSFLKAECKVSDIGSAHWVSSLHMSLRFYGIDAVANEIDVVLNFFFLGTKIQHFI